MEGKGTGDTRGNGEWVEGGARFPLAQPLPVMLHPFTLLICCCVPWVY